MKTRHPVLAALSLAALALVACDKSGSSGSTTSTVASAPASAAPLASATPLASASASASSSPERGRGNRVRKAPGAMFFRATRDLTDLTDAQKASLDKIVDAMKDQPGAKPEFKEFQAELLSEVKAGKVEAAKLLPRQKAIDTAMQARIDGETQSLTQLHDLLRPAQRKALTAAVRAKQAKMEERFTKMKAEGVAPPKPADVTRLKVMRLTTGLDLDATQDKAMDGVVARLAPKAEQPGEARTEWKKQADALITEFEKDAFDAKKLEFYTKANTKGHEGLQDQIDMITALVPVLTPGQREKLAAKLEHPSTVVQGGPEGHAEPHFGFEKHWTGPWQEDDGPQSPDSAWGNGASPPPSAH